MSTKIQWTDVTDNIITVKGGGWWCRKISPGCANCYAAKLNQNSFFGGNKRSYIGAAPEMELNLKTIARWETMRKPKRHFVASMTDVFGDWVPQWMVNAFLDGMRVAPKQTFQVLTKRPDIAADKINRWLRESNVHMPKNIWIGFSAENRQCLRERWEAARKVDTDRIFISIEPLLEDVSDMLRLVIQDAASNGIRLWVIIGGESGTGARAAHCEWFNSAVETCVTFGVPCFMKQLGVCLSYRMGCADKKGGDISEWPLNLRVRQFPEGM